MNLIKMITDKKYRDNYNKKTAYLKAKSGGYKITDYDTYKYFKKTIDSREDVIFLYSIIIYCGVFFITGLLIGVSIGLR